MANFRNMFVTDKDLEKNGVWHPLGAGVKIKVARMGTSEYNATLRSLAQPYKNIAKMVVDGNADVLSKEDMAVFKRLESQAIAKHVLVDWSGFTTEEGAEVAYSEDTAMEYLCESDDFRSIVVDLGSKMGHFKVESKGN